MVISIGLRAGIVFRSTSALWTFHDMDVFAFDKTGTLTEGQMTVEDSYLIDPQARLLVAALVANQFHPISKAVARSLRVDPDSMAFIKQAVSDVIVEAPNSRRGSTSRTRSKPSKTVPPASSRSLSVDKRLRRFSSATRNGQMLKNSYRPSLLPANAS
jgi:P-type E1-E2 ATPase